MLKPQLHSTVTNAAGFLKHSGKTLWVSTTFEADEEPYYSTVQGAITAAGAGDLVWVHNGTYEEDLVLAEGVRLHFEPGAIVQPPATGRAGYHIDVDGLTAVITGHGKFLFPAASTASQYHITVRNGGNLSIECEKIDQTGVGDPANPGLHIEESCTVQVDIKDFCRKIAVEGGGITFGDVNLSGWVKDLVTLYSMSADLRGVLNTGSLSIIDIEYPAPDPQLFRYQINVERRHVSSFTSRIAGKARIDLRIGEWIHTPSVDGEHRFQLEDSADLLFSGNCVSNLAGYNSGPFFHLLADTVTLILKNTVMVTDHLYTMTSPVFCVYRAYASYANTDTDKVNAFGGLSIEQNDNTLL